MDIATLGLKVDSGPVVTANRDLAQLTGAAGAAERAVRGLAGGAQAEAAGMKAATAATMAHTAALNAQNMAMRVTNQQRTMMIYQLNDVAVSLASGMNPMMVAMQQGSQILQGGFMPAIRTMGDLLRGLVTRFWPVAAAVGAVSAALSGLAYEFNKTGEVQVSMLDVAIAGWQMFSETVTHLVTPVFSQIGQWLQDGWNAAAPVLKTAGNAIIGAFVGAYDAVKATWSLLPSALGDLVIQAVNGVITALEQMLQRVTDSVNGFIRSINGAIMMVPENLRGGWTGIGEIGEVSIPRAGNPYAGAAANAKDAATGAFMGAQRDYLGGLGGAWDARAEQVALARQEMDALGGSTKAANDNVKALNDTSKDLAETWGGTLKSAWSGFWSDFHSGIKKGESLWAALGGAAMNALDKLTSKALDMAANGIWDMILGAFGPTLGMGSWGIGSGMRGTSSITGSSGGYFPAFDGGGYTGSGSRSGGMDGKGGFLAMMHPNETVIDHSRGQSGGGTSVVRIELGPDLESRVLTQAAGQSLQIVRASQPDTVQKATAASDKALASGDFRRGMASYGLQQQAKRR